MVPTSMKKKVLAKLVDNVVRSQDYHIDTGIIGARYILDVLTDNGYGEVAYKVATNKTYPGWGYMIEEGATTLWERWEKITGGGMNSHNHVMFASIDAWFYRAVAGLSLLDPGWAKIRIKPPLFPDLKFASAELQTIHGIVRVSWRKSESVFHMHVYIPVGAKAEIYVPILNDEISIECNGIKVFKRGKMLDTKCNIKFAGIKDGYLVISTGSGCYIFKAQ
jgi:alpha-L-rhamnosidase